MNDTDIGKRIKQYRKGKMTQQELASKINRTESSIRKYEKGLVTIPLDVLDDIASALGVTSFDLMGFEYWDQKNPNLAKQVAELEGFTKYLNSIGYTVKDVPKGGNGDEGATSCSYTVSGNGLSVTLSAVEYNQLQSSSDDLIYSFLCRKQQK